MNALFIPFKCVSIFSENRQHRVDTIFSENAINLPYNRFRSTCIRICKYCDKQTKQKSGDLKKFKRKAGFTYDFHREMFFVSNLTTWDPELQICCSRDNFYFSLKIELQFTTLVDSIKHTHWLLFVFTELNHLCTFALVQFSPFTYNSNAPESHRSGCCCYK